MKNLLKILLSIIVVAASIKSYAQVPPDTSTTQKLLQYIMQP